MKRFSFHLRFVSLILFFWLAASIRLPVTAQPPFPLAGLSPLDAQREVLNQMDTQLRFLYDSTRNAQRIPNGAEQMLFDQVEALRISFETLKRTLVPVQVQRGANDLAELDAGLAIISEAFPNFREDLANGRSLPEALRTLCQVLRESFQLWARQLNVTATRLRIGR